MKQNKCTASMCFPNRRAAKRYIIVSIWVFILAGGFPPPAWSGVIRTTISSHRTITASGAVELRLEIRNEGDVTAYKMAVTLTLSDVIHRFPDLGENLPGGSMTLKDRIEHPGWKPGVYVGVITVSFEEQDGKPHLVDHFFTVQYGMKNRHLGPAPLELRAGGLVFNPKAFWRKEEPLRVTLKNLQNTSITPELRLYLPEGYTSPDDAGAHPLPPGGEDVVMFRVFRNADAKANKTVHLIATYEFNGLHYTSHLKKVIRLEKKPVFFKGYLMGSGGVLVLLWGGLAIFRRRVKGVE